MTLWAHIADGVLLGVGDLPASARRLDTGQKVFDLEGTGAVWRRACGYFDAATVHPVDVTEDGAKQLQLAADLAAALAAQGNRQQFITKVQNLADLARDQNWDWIDSYCDPNVAQIPLILQQSPNAGADWGALNAFGQAQALRVGVSLAMIENIRFAQAIALILDVLSQLVADDPNVTPPGDR